MSFILDALKKSEIERQRQTVPGLLDPGTAAPGARFPLWAIGLGALLGVNLVVLCLFLLRGGSSGANPPRGAAPLRGSIAAARAAAAQPAPIAAEVAPLAAEAAPAGLPAPPPPTAGGGAGGADHFSPMDGASTYAPEIPLTPADADVDEAAAAPSNRAPARRSEPTLRAAGAGSAASRPAEPPDEVLPSISELNLTGVDALPDLHLDVHVYATNPADRFVYINMRKYREGSQLQEGPILEHIRRDGVVLNSQGIRFLLPRDR
jgi:general secretion pathway protein B